MAADRDPKTSATATFESPHDTIAFVCFDPALTRENSLMLAKFAFPIGKVVSMPSDQIKPPAATLPAPLDQMHMAVERTYLAHERTLLAWVRTGTSLVTFGLTLHNFFEYLHEQDPVRHPSRILGARTMGLMLIVIGLATLATACWQHRQRTQFLRTMDPGLGFSPAYLLAALMALLGFLALLAPLSNF